MRVLGIIFSIILSAAWFLADFITKIWAVENLSEPIMVNQFMNFRLAYNKGAAFSFLAEQGGWQRWFFIALAVLICLWIIWELFFKNLDFFNRFGLSSIFGGALGNLYDRAVNGKVVDFIQWHYQDFYWPIFNIADVVITSGVVALILASFVQVKNSSTSAIDK